MLRRALYGAVGLVLIGSAGAQAQAPVDSTFMAGMRWRSIGPANMSGRITDIEGIPSPSRTFYVASAAGGIWKTTNAGTTFRPLFTNERVISMGDLAIAPSDTLQVWAGTGEEDSRNSISPGRGIYKSTDGGLTWKLMGLEKTGAIARIVVHPTNPDIVWVAALGQIWGSNPERGLYKTTDGGRTWQLKKFVSDKAGFADVAINPSNPDILFAASWERVRGPYFLKSGGPGSALWKSTDGGETWTEVKGGGFPATLKGRIGLAISRSNPNVVYALVEAAPPNGPEWNAGCRQAQPGGCGLYRSQDGGATWEWMSGENVRPFYYSQVRVDPKDPNRVYWSSTPVKYSNDGGRTAGNTTVGLHVDHHAMWIDPNDANRIIVGNDGGVGISFDKGGSWIFANTFPIGQFYAVSFDMDVPYNVCGGLQDNGSWCGPSRRPSGPITNEMWFNAGGGDGFYTAQDPRYPWIIYSESQGGSMGRYDLRTHQRESLRKPTWRDAYVQFEDSIVIETGDARELSAQQRRRIEDLRKRQVADSASMNLRYNWNTPFLLSPHNPDVFYAGSNRVLKSSFRGEDLHPISPDLSTQDEEGIRVSTETTGGVTSDVTGAETYSTIVSLAESPVVRGKLFAGTDDGNVWMSPNDGGTWTNLTSKFKGLVPPKTYVSRIEPSHFDANTFYVTFDGHRTNDFKPYVFVTTDNGASFRSIASNLPTGGPDFVHVIREDLKNPNLLFLGTDVGLYVSIDKGASWSKFMNGLPTVPVHDLKIHPRDHELIAGTHGRSIWIANIAPLQQMTPAILAQGGVFEPRPAYLGGEPGVGGGSSGHMVFEAPGGGGDAEILYWLPRSSGPARINIAIVDASGDTIHTMTGPGTRGLHQVEWNLRVRSRESVALSPSERRDSALIMRRLEFVADSLIKAGGDREDIERIVAQARNPEQGGGGFGRGGGGGRGDQGEGWVERPGETPVSSGGREQGGRGGNSLARTMRDLLQLEGGRPSMYEIPGFGGRGGRGGDATTVEPGQYTVVVKAGDRTFTTRLRVEQDPDLVTDEGGR